MNIFGIGCDIVHNKRIFNFINKTMLPKFLQKVLHPQQLLTFQQKVSDPIRVQFIASRWAVKQAANKSIGKRQLVFNQMKIVKDQNGKPHLQFDQGQNTQLLNQLGIQKIHISLAHEDNYAIGYAIAIKKQSQQIKNQKIE